MSGSSLELNLWEAACVDDVNSLAERLSESDCYVDLENDSGATALHLCASRGQARAARFLLERGADINRRDKVRS